MSLAVNHLIGFGAKRATAVSEQDVTWNPSDKDADVTLSNGDRNATSSGAGSVRATHGKTSGKYYCEIQLLTGMSNFRAGLGNGSFSLSTYVGNSASSGGVASGGNTVSTWTKAQAGTFTIVANDVLGFAVDMGVGYAWVSLNGVWQLTGDPAAGTNPWMTGLSGTVYPAAGFAGSTANVQQLRAKTSEVTYSPPSGFSVWATA